LTYPESPSTFAELLRIAEDVISRRSRNFVNDAILMARWIEREGKRAIDDRRELVGLLEGLESDPTPARIQAALSIAKGMIR
jgi:hypothetical protein